MKKEQMQQVIDEQQTRIQSLYESLKNQKDNYEEIIKKMSEEKEEQDYQNWKQLNGKFMERFMFEYLSEKMHVNVDMDESNYLDMSLSIDETVISSETCHIF